MSPWPGPRRFGSLTCTWAIWPPGIHAAINASTGTDSVWPAALQSIMVFNAGEPISSTSRTASATVLIRSVSRAASGSMQYVTPQASARLAARARQSAARAHAVAAVSPTGTERCFGEPCTR